MNCQNASVGIGLEHNANWQIVALRAEENDQLFLIRGVFQIFTINRAADGIEYRQ
jgi:hypothetical protein